jgi:HlyD family secretion protein
VRLHATTRENVVNYTVVVDVGNEDGRLLPGMTASVKFVVAGVRDVLRAPNAALRIVPSERMRAELGLRNGGGPRLFYLDPQGRLAVAPVRAGLSDGQLTEVAGPGLAEGVRVVAGLNDSAPVAGVSNPLQGNTRQQQGGPPPPPGPGF